MNIPKSPYMIGSCKIFSVSPSEWRKMQLEAIKTWHFEKTINGVKPVEGKYDPTNPMHIGKNNILHQKFKRRFKE